MYRGSPQVQRSLETYLKITFTSSSCWKLCEVECLVSNIKSSEHLKYLKDNEKARSLCVIWLRKIF